MLDRAKLRRKACHLRGATRFDTSYPLLQRRQLLFERGTRSLLSFQALLIDPSPLRIVRRRLSVRLERLLLSGLLQEVRFIPYVQRRALFEMLLQLQVVSLFLSKLSLTLIDGLLSTLQAL